MNNEKELHRLEKKFHKGMEDYQNGYSKPLEGTARELGWLAAKQMAEIKSKYLQQARNLTDG